MIYLAICFARCLLKGLKVGSNATRASLLSNAYGPSPFPLTIQVFNVLKLISFPTCCTGTEFNTARLRR